VTHDQADAFAVGDGIMVLKRGTNQQVGSPEDLYNEPTNVFVANFIGDPPMNILKLKVSHPLVETLNIRNYVPEGDDEIYVGIRPDEAVAGTDLKNAHLAGKVIIGEYVGSRKYAKVSVQGGTTLRVLVEENVEDGDEVKISIKKLHVFSSKGKRIKTVTF